MKKYSKIKVSLEQFFNIANGYGDPYLFELDEKTKEENCYLIEDILRGKLKLSEVQGIIPYSVGDTIIFKHGIKALAAKIEKILLDRTDIVKNDVTCFIFYKLI